MITPNEANRQGADADGTDHGHDPSVIPSAGGQQSRESHTNGMFEWIYD